MHATIRFTNWHFLTRGKNPYTRNAKVLITLVYP